MKIRYAAIIANTSAGCSLIEVNSSAPKRNRIPASMAAAMALGRRLINLSNAPDRPTSAMITDATT
ncbi:hypothetical protein D3C78_1667070 [compost metagenome]